MIKSFFDFKMTTILILHSLESNASYNNIETTIRHLWPKESGYINRYFVDVLMKLNINSSSKEKNIEWLRKFIAGIPDTQEKICKTIYLSPGDIIRFHERNIQIYKIGGAPILPNDFFNGLKIVAKWTNAERYDYELPPNRFFTIKETITEETELVTYDPLIAIGNALDFMAQTKTEIYNTLPHILGVSNILYYE